jgi:serine/threonine-protein kinase
MTREPDAREATAEADTLSTGSRLGQVFAGKYRLERWLGRGGMGEVYEARHVVVGRRFAVKFLHPELARGSESVSRFLREAQAAGALDNPHLVAVLDFDTAADGSPFLVMEYLSGESLAATLAREGALPLRRTLSILLQVCDGLEVAHRAGIVHRDLKPDNLFVTRQRDGSDLIKILDFGIAKLVDPGPQGGVTRSGAVLGTPFYMAPEQARGEKSVDLRVDLYALGVVAYQLLSGQMPHPGDGYNAILAHILTQPIPPLRELCPELPGALIDVIERTLSSDPARRPASAAELERALAPFAGRAVSMADSHFDLRPPGSDADVGTPLPTQPVVDAPEQAAGGTLASAIGDVQGSASSREGKRRTTWLVLAAALAAAGLLLVKTRSGSTPARAQAQISSSASVADDVNERALPAALSEASMAPGGLTPSATTLPSARPAPRVSAAISGKKPGSVSARPVSSGREISFDEKNPY